MKRTLTITGDDFGLTPGINRGIVVAHTRGVLTHASLMATAPFAADAIRLARDTPSLSVGVHLMLVDGAPCLPGRLVPTLVDGGRHFRPSAGAFVRDWVLARLNVIEVELELRAQIERVFAGGVRPTHLDSHTHLHMWPPIFEIVARLALEYEIPSIRLALERPLLRLVIETAGDPVARHHAVHNLSMAPLAWVDARMFAPWKQRPAAFAGRTYTGMMTPERLARVIARLPAGDSELMTHPGYVDEHLASVRTCLREERERELEILCAPSTRALLERECVRLAEIGVRGTWDVVRPAPTRVKESQCCES
jgi:predicted glycoside hydrolase/deacetylase ChbG (UPF0249 family)